MTDLAAAVIGATAAIAGGLLTGAFQVYWDYRTGPVLKIDFDSTSPATKVENEYLAGNETKQEVYVRARVRNVGQRPAMNCRVYLTKLSEVNGKHLGNTVFYDAMPVSWAGWDFDSRVLPKDADFYVDVMRVSKHDPGWMLSVKKLFASHEKLKKYRGTYRFHLLATADNAAAANHTVDVAYDGDWHNLRAWHEADS
jgi:hypothetical protein